jgi:hypothetical protein
MKITGPKPRADIDLHLHVASVAQRANPTLTWGRAEIAEFCGCHHSLIQQIERKALGKLRTRATILSR